MATDSRIGTTVAGYRIESVVGRGGMGVVYLAEQVALGRKVALKVLAPDLAGDPRFRDRFLRESRVAASLEDPNILPVHEAGESEGALFIAMRYVRGTDLRRLIDSEGPLAPERTVSILSQVASALDAAHAEGLIHRDVKPANVLLVPGTPDKVYLADFGLTKRATSDSGVTGTGQFVGTLDYAAPEQFTGDPLTPATDVYSLGCLLYECLVGEPPFPRDREAAVLHAHLNEPPPKPTEKRPGLPAAIDAVVAKAMAKKPGERYPLAGELARAARDAIGPTREEPDAGRPRSRRAALAAVGAAAVAVALAVILLTRGGSTGESPGTTSPGSSSPSASSSPGFGFSSGVVALDPKTGAIRRAIPAPGGFRLGGLLPQIVSGEGAVWTDPGTGVLRIDPTTGRDLVVPLNVLIYDVAIGQGAIWATAGSDLVRIDPATEQVVDRTSLPATAFLATPYVLAVPGTVWLGGQSGELTPVDPGSDQAGKSIKVASSIRGVAYGLGALWVLDDFDETVLKLDPTTGAKLDTFPVAGNPVAIAADFGSVWVADASGTLTRLDPFTGAPTGPIRVGQNPTDIATGLGAVWVTNQGDGTISRIDPITNDSSEITVGASVAAVVADPRSREIWVAIAPIT
ncbi:MAG: protein kinase [Actinomycetota bacterium]|nr:protein kinase [Actinomycetota bacterium]